MHKKRTATDVHPFVDLIMVSPPLDPQIRLHAELRLHQRRWHVLDVGVRPGAGLVSQSVRALTGTDLQLMHLRASLGRPVSLPSAASKTRHAATCIACCYIADRARPATTLGALVPLASELAEAEDIFGWHLNAAEIRDAFYMPDAGLSVGIGANDTAAAVARASLPLPPLYRQIRRLIRAHRKLFMTTLHHLCMTTSQMPEATRFYDAVLGPLGYSRELSTDRLSTWHGQAPEILVWAVEGDNAAPHTFGRPGWHHAAFAAEDRDAVLAVHKAVVCGDWTVVREPREYPEYSDGYFAVFVEDPDGLRIEVAHIP